MNSIVHRLLKTSKMSIVNAIASPLSQLPLWRKKSTPLQQTSRVGPTMVEDDREEDGFTFVGESESERNAVYPQKSNIPWEPPPPSYHQVSSLPYSTQYLPRHGNRKRASLPHSINEQMQNVHGQEMRSSCNEQLPPKTILNIKDCILEVPFTLAPHIADLLSRDECLMHCLPRLDESAFMYDFSFERQVISSGFDQQKSCDNDHEINDEFGNWKSHIDQCSNDTEDQILHVYEQKATVAQNMDDLIGGGSPGYQGVDTQQDLMSF